MTTTAITGAKLDELADQAGMDFMEMLEEATFDSVAWSICMNDGCDYTTQLEPDSRSGYCPECKTRSMKSCLVLAGMI